MRKTKAIYIFICTFMFFSIFGLIQNNTSLRRTVAFTDTYPSNKEEWWIEVEITPIDGKQETNDDVLLLLYDDFLSHKRESIKSWHFFREPTLRFRIELTDRENRDNIAVELKNFLDSIELIADHYFARHGERIENFDEGYAGERDQYKRMWPYQKKLWEWGSEMTVEGIREFRETGANDPSREYQLERVFHLLSNQLSPGYEVKRQREYLFLAVASVFLALVVSIALSVLYSIKLRRIRARL